VIIDMQRDYFPGGAHPLVGPVQAATAGRRLVAEALRSRNIDALVVAGMTSSMCVDATVRAAVDQGLTATVAHDACAAPLVTRYASHMCQPPPAVADDVPDG
jgi:nicotinamidase-related amidase